MISEYLIHKRDTNEITPSQKEILDKAANEYKKYILPKRARNRSWKNWRQGTVNSIKIRDEDIDDVMWFLNWGNEQKKLFESTTDSQLVLAGLTLREQAIHNKIDSLSHLLRNRNEKSIEKIIDHEITRLQIKSGDELATFPTKHRVLPGYNSHDFNPKKKWVARAQEPNNWESDY